MIFGTHDAKARIEAIRKHNGLGEKAAIGIVGSFGTEVSVDESNNNRDIICIANTADIDLDSEVVVPEGLDGKEYFFKNKKIFVDHRYEFSNCVGMMRSARLAKTMTGTTGWMVRFRVLSMPGNDLPDAVLTCAREGFGPGFSIGFEAIDYGKPTAEEMKAYSQTGKQLDSVVRKSKWLELSATMIPCNVSCQGQAKVDEKALAGLDELLTKGRISRKSAVLLGLPEAPKRKFFATVVV